MNWGRPTIGASPSRCRLAPFSCLRHHRSNGSFSCRTSRSRLRRPMSASSRSCPPRRLASGKAISPSSPGPSRKWRMTTITSIGGASRWKSARRRWTCWSPARTAGTSRSSTARPRQSRARRFPANRAEAAADMLQLTLTPFDQTLAAHGHDALRALRIDTLQVNVGKLCNQTCTHCHVDAGPTRTEIMTRETAEAVLDVVRRYPDLRTVDITGGAPELNPYFEYLVEQCRAMGRHVMDRCNLTVFFVRGKEHLPRFLAEHQVEVIASLPCYLKENVDQQRGKGVYDRSIAALQALNALGYGREETGLTLNLVYNPLGPKLPPPQANLEADYRDELAKRFGIFFNRLYTITNMLINRFLGDLQSSGPYERYMELLVTSFNPAAVDGLMCRNLISVSWDGRLYDCDFNLMLDLPVDGALPQTIHEFDLALLARRQVVTGLHCYGCTAGAGSSCGGAIA